MSFEFLILRETTVRFWLQFQCSCLLYPILVWQVVAFLQMLVRTLVAWNYSEPGMNWYMSAAHKSMSTKVYQYPSLLKFFYKCLNWLQPLWRWFRTMFSIRFQEWRLFSICSIFTFTTAWLARTSCPIKVIRKGIEKPNGTLNAFFKDCYNEWFTLMLRYLKQLRFRLLSIFPRRPHLLQMLVFKNTHTSRYFCTMHNGILFANLAKVLQYPRSIPRPLASEFRELRGMRKYCICSSH